MSLIDRAATFRGSIVDHGVSLSTNDFPQWIVQLLAAEIWDPEEDVWVDWTPYDENEITGYMILLGSKGETLTANQIKKAVGWDGTSYTSLNNMDLSEAKVQFRVEPNTYNDKTTLQVAWIDEFDAVPGRSVRKLNADDLKALDAKCKRYLTGAKKAAPATATGKPKSPPAVKAKGIKSTQKKGPVTPKKGKKGAVDPLAAPEMPTAAPIAPAPKPPAQAIGECTKQEAWDGIVEATKDKRTANEITDNQLGEAWQKAVGKHSKDPDKLTNEQWYQVRVKVTDELGVGLPF